LIPGVSIRCNPARRLPAALRIAHDRVVPCSTPVAMRRVEQCVAERGLADTDAAKHDVQLACLQLVEQSLDLGEVLAKFAADGRLRDIGSSSSARARWLALRAPTDSLWRYRRCAQSARRLCQYSPRSRMRHLPLPSPGSPQ
jgi:hypothetical protein